jgi:hypothetical protein
VNRGILIHGLLLTWVWVGEPYFCNNKNMNFKPRFYWICAGICFIGINGLVYYLIHKQVIPHPVIPQVTTPPLEQVPLPKPRPHIVHPAHTSLRNCTAVKAYVHQHGSEAMSYLNRTAQRLNLVSNLKNCIGTK